jgi:sugar phosphate isomerase/epimerase
VDKRALIGPAESALAIARAVRRDCPNFGLMVDLSHIPLLGESPKEALVPVREHLMHIHIGNAAFRDRSHPA